MNAVQGEYTATGETAVIKPPSVQATEAWSF